MSDGADDSLDLLIRLKSDTTGAGAAKSELEGIAGAQAKGTEATGEATKATEKHTVGLHQMHRLFHALNEVVPGLGVAMQAAFSPIGAAISLAVIGISDDGDWRCVYPSSEVKMDWLLDPERQELYSNQFREGVDNFLRKAAGEAGDKE